MNRDRVTAVTVHVPNCQADLGQVRAVRLRDAIGDASVNGSFNAFVGGEYYLGGDERALMVNERFLDSYEEAICLKERSSALS